MGGRPGYIFEIFENGHIFLKFYFFLNIKKKKPPQAVGSGPNRLGPAHTGHRNPLLSPPAATAATARKPG